MGDMPSTVDSVGTLIDWKAFWQAIRDHLLWDLEFFDGSAWVSVKEDLKVERSFPEENRCKFKLTFNASQRGNYRLTFTIDKKLRDYVERVGEKQIDVTVEDKILTFDWNDCAGISGLQFSHGLKDVRGEQYFWFRIRRDNVPLGAHVEIDPSVVGTSTSAYATHYPFQRKSFYANGLFWVFYSDGTNMVYRTSTDGVSWSSATAIRLSGSGYAFSIWFDGTYLHYAFASASSIYYRRGLPNADGTITWSTDIEQTVSTTYNKAYYPMVSVDSNGYVWIGYRDYDGTNYYPYVIKSGNNDGTWGTTPSGFPYQLSTTSGYWGISIIPLTAGKMLAVYVYSSGTLRARRWDGSAWGTEKATTSATISFHYHSAVAEGDNVHLVFLKSSGYDILYVKYIYASDAFSSEVTVEAGATISSAPVLSMDDAGKLYCFWATTTTGTPVGATANHIYYQTSADGGSTWSARVDWINEETETLTSADRLTCFYKQYGNYIGLVYMTNTATSGVYNVKFAFLTVAVPPPIVRRIIGDGLTCVVVLLGPAVPPSPWEGWMDELF